MKRDYVLRHFGPSLNIIVCVFPSYNLARKAMEIYAKYVEWNWKTKITYTCTWETQFENMHTIMIFDELRASSLKEFKQTLNFNEDECKI